MYKFSFFFLLMLNYTVHGQIISADTVCVGTNVTFQTPAQGRSFTWSFETSPNITPVVPPSATLITTGGLLNLPSIFCMANENGNWYTFVTNYSANNIVRLNYGTSPTNTPTLVSLGTFGMTGGIAGGIDVVKDDITGNWFGFVANGTQLLRMEFGSSLANTPTGTLMNFPSNFAWPHEMRLKKIGTNWIGFVANRNGVMTRLDWGANLTTTPTATNLPTTNYSAPVAFSISKQGNNWHMFVVSLLGSFSGLTRLDFGSNIQNNAPATTYLGNFSGQLSLPRGVEIVSDCDQVYGYVMNESGDLYKMDFSNNITNATPTLSNLANMSSNAISMYMYNNELRAQLLSSYTNTFRTLPLQTYPGQTVTNYYNPIATHTFTSPGIYNVTLWTDQGLLMGGTSYCKQIVVTNTTNAFLGSDTIVCGSNTYTLNAASTGAGSYLWNTGATTPSITVNLSGTYWVALTGSACTTGDSIQVTLKPNPVVQASADTMVCKGTAFSMGASGANNYVWNPASTLNNPSVPNPVAQPQQSTTYYVTGTDSSGCTGKDSVTVIVNPLPAIHASNDTTICKNSTVNLSASGGNQYNWLPVSYLNNPAIANPVAQPPQSITYYVSTTDGNGCTGRDSVIITVNDFIIVEASPDTVICSGSSINLQANGATTYSWFPSSYLNSSSVSNPVARPLQSITYHVSGTDDNGCSGTDSVTVTVKALPVIEIHAASNVTDCGSNGIQMNATGGITYSWEPATNFNNSQIPDPIATPLESGTIYVTGKDASGCMNTDSLFITVKKNEVFFVPNVFSPNGDGKNDIFLPRIYCDFSLAEFSIYNRFGQRVYRTTEKDKGWNGLMNSQECEVGAYFWYIDGKDAANKKVSKKGDLLLIR